MMSCFTYLDYNATTPVDRRVAMHMLEKIESAWGNASSSHRIGRAARAELDAARRQAATALGSNASEVVFTSGGTESNNMAILGVLGTQREAGRTEIVTSTIEHPAVLEVCRYVEREGMGKVHYVAVDSHGTVKMDELTQCLSDKTALVTIMHANNEIEQQLMGAAAVRKLRRQRDVHAARYKEPMFQISVNPSKLGVDLLTVCSHKFYGPKGVGALFIGASCPPLKKVVHGANHEAGRRPGTGMAYAMQLAVEELETRSLRMREHRDALHNELKRALGDRVVLHGHVTDRLPNTLNVGIRGVNGSSVVSRLLDELGISVGSACHEGEVSISHVLAAIGASPESARGALRLSTGKETTAEDVQRAIRLLLEAIAAVDASAPK